MHTIDDQCNVIELITEITRKFPGTWHVSHLYMLWIRFCSVYLIYSSCTHNMRDVDPGAPQRSRRICIAPTQTNQPIPITHPYVLSQHTNLTMHSHIELREYTPRFDERDVREVMCSLVFDACARLMKGWRVGG